MTSVMPDDYLAERVAARAQRLQRGADAAELEVLAQIIREKAMTLQCIGVVVEEAKRLERASDPGLYEARDSWAKDQQASTVRQASYAVRCFCEVNGAAERPTGRLFVPEIDHFWSPMPQSSMCHDQSQRSIG